MKKAVSPVASRYSEYDDDNDDDDGGNKLC